jgi:hypothetical protein
MLPVFVFSLSDDSVECLHLFGTLFSDKQLLALVGMSEQRPRRRREGEPKEFGVAFV